MQKDIKDKDSESSPLSFGSFCMTLKTLKTWCEPGFRKIVCKEYLHEQTSCMRVTQCLIERNKLRQV